MTHFAIPFEETVIPMARPETRAEILKLLADGQMPGAQGRRDRGVGIAGDHRISRREVSRSADLAGRQARRARSRARSRTRCTAGFQALRNHCPTQFLRPVRKIALTPEVEADVARHRGGVGGRAARFGAGGPFLFGAFSAADAMFAPVVNRFHTYDIAVGRGRAPIWTRSWRCRPGRRGSPARRGSRGASRATTEFETRRRASAKPRTPGGGGKSGRCRLRNARGIASPERPSAGSGIGKSRDEGARAADGCVERPSRGRPAYPDEALHRRRDFVDMFHIGQKIWSRVNF